jgi:hypothetical protein
MVLQNFLHLLDFQTLLAQHYFLQWKISCKMLGRLLKIHRYFLAMQNSIHYIVMCKMPSKC